MTKNNSISRYISRGLSIYKYILNEKWQKLIIHLVYLFYPYKFNHVTKMTKNNSLLLVYLNLYYL